MTVGPLLGEQLLEIAQTNISKGNSEYGSTIYEKAFGKEFTKDLTLKVLKNELVVVTNDDGLSINLTDDKNVLEENAHNIFNWKHIIESQIADIQGIRSNLDLAVKEFNKLYAGSIIDYRMPEMLKRYFSDPEDYSKMSGKLNIAARICGSPDCKICDRGNSNPTSIWERVEDKMENYENPDVPKWEKILYWTVRYNKLIRQLHKAYLNFENTYLFLVENEFIEKPCAIEAFIENTLYVLKQFADTTKGYCHPLCNEGLYGYKTTLSEDLLLHTKYGKEYLCNGIIAKDIMDGYDAGWLSPDGVFYGADGETSSMIHQTLADEIFHGNGPIANAMIEDGVTEFGSEQSDYWLEKNGWIKIHHNEIYGSFIGDATPSEDFPYPYCPTSIQIKMICDYADKFYRGKLYTQPQIVRATEPVSTYKLRQMDKFKLHELFGH